MAHTHIVNDHPMLHEMLHAHHASAEHTVKIVQRLHDALHLSRSTSFALLFFNFHTPDANRLQALQRVAKTFSSQKITLLIGAANAISNSPPGRASFSPRLTTSLDNAPLGINEHLRNSSRNESGDNIQYQG